MYAIVEIAGQQFKVEEGKKIFVHRLENEEDAVVEFDKVLLVEDGDKVLIGEPVVKDFIVEGKVIDDSVRGDKVIIFKKKRKKGYRIKNGHRQNFTQIEITGIGQKGSIVRTAPKKEQVKKAEPEVQAEEVVETKPAGKKAAPKKAAVKKEEKPVKEVKKPAPKKAAVKKPAAKKSSKTKE